MDNIEKSINHFFQRLGHTPGPWFYNEDFDIRPSNKPAVAYAIWDTVVYKEPTAEANGRLISEAPAMLRTICRTYLWMLVNVKYRGTLTVDQTLADLRNQISEATGIECQEVQDSFEQYALWIHTGDIAIHPDFYKRRG